MRLNEEYFESQLKSKGLKKGFIADKMGIDINTLTRKIQGKSELKYSEATIMFEILGADTLELQANFFTHDVDKVPT